MRDQGQAIIMAFLFNFLMPVSLAVDSNCDFSQNMITGQTYYIYNSEYPNNYRPSVSCRWLANSPINTKIVLSCEEINLPATTNCQGDRLSISLTGNAALTDAHNYCGTGTLSVVSVNNRIAIGLTSMYNSPGGRFLCTATAIVQNPITTTPRPNVCDCGWRQQRRIVGGTETGVYEYPSMAGIVDYMLRKVICGATIISNNYAMSAAHCVYKKNATNLGILAGDHRLSTGNEAQSILYNVQRYTIHVAYNPQSEQNDIAVLKTQNLIAFNLNVGPVCLPFRYTSTSFAAAQATVLGWGTTDFSDPTSDVLLAANLTVVTNAYCQSRLTNNVIFPTQICTYTPGKDACQFDSGGPLLWFDPNTRRDNLVGIISYGLGCATSYPGVNTRVSSYLQWIIETTGNTQYCIK